ncbi:MAG: hypothetical protein MMC23_003081 [Stictis urceolatum]|nr:hypothetical protein [Stictis urceolata]
MASKATPQSSNAAASQNHAQPLSSNPPSPAEPPLRQNGLFNSWNKTGSGRKSKRSYSDLNELENAPTSPSAQLQTDLDGTVVDEHADKRSRGTHWPLSPSASQNGSKSSRVSRTPRNGSRSRRRFAKPSKFIEASMRDRDSEMPPDQYLRVEPAMQEYSNGVTGNCDDADDSGVRHSGDTNVSIDAGIERSRPSSMYRFGKAIANAFNPATMWSGIFGKERTTPSPVKDPFQGRKLQVEIAYAELKKSGFKGIGTEKQVSNRSSTDLSANRDSGVDVSSFSSSRDHKRDGLVFDDSGIPLLAPPPIPDDDAQPSPGTEYSSGPGSSKRIHKRGPSMPSLRKMKSHFSLAGARRDPISPLPSIENDEQMQKIKKKQSKKDLQKQQKLSKKISNLETQLEKAKEELNKTIGIDEEVVIKEEDEEYEDVEREDDDEGLAEETQIDEAIEAEPHVLPQNRYAPGRRFVPNLPTLPSERVLFAQSKSSQIPASRYSNRDLPPKSVNPDPLTFSIEQALGMHEDEEIMPPLKMRNVASKKQDDQKSKKTAPKKAISATPKKVIKVSPKEAKAKKGAAKANSSRKVNDSAVASDEDPEPAGQSQTTRKTTRKRRKSSDDKDTTFEPTQDDSDGEWMEPSKPSPKNRVTRQSTGRRVSMQDKKENAKPGGIAFTNKSFDSIDTVFKTEEHSPNTQPGLSLHTPSNQNHAANAAVSPLSTASTIDDPRLFAEATAYAPEVKNISDVASKPPTRAPPAPPLSFFSPGSEPLSSGIKPTTAHILSPTNPLRPSGRLLSPPPREASPTAIPLPAGSPIRGGGSLRGIGSTKGNGSLRSNGSGRSKNGSPRPALKRAGHSGPIRDAPVSITPGKDMGRGVPPVPKIPEGVVGKRSFVKAKGKGKGEEWDGWDDDVF